MHKPITQLTKKVQELEAGKLRSGKRYKPNMSDDDNKTPPPTQPGQSGQGSSIPPITILHDDSTGPKFTGRDNDPVSVYQFLREGEDIIRKRQLTTDQDKINVLRERVSTEQCPARNVLFTDFFLQCKNYEDFKRCMITTFASTSKLGPISALFRLAELFRENYQEKDIYEALMHASNTQSSILDQFENTDWLVNDTFSRKRVAVIISYIHFLTMVSPALFKKLQTSQLKPTDSLWLHAQEFFKFKGEQTATPVRAFNMAKTETTSERQSRPRTRDQSRRKYASRSPSRGRSQTPGKEAYCPFCRRKGHTLGNCWTVGHNKYCVYHDSRTHDTKDCRGRKTVTHKQSGEVKRSQKDVAR